MSNWVFGNHYAVKVVTGQHVIKTLPNEKRTQLVEVLCEVTRGPMAGQRIRYQGYINTPENAARTLRDLRVMGFRGERWGDWTGLGVGGREFEVRVMADERDGRSFPRAAFPRAKQSVSASEFVASEEEIERLNDKLPGFSDLDAINEARDHDAAQAKGDGAPF